MKKYLMLVCLPLLVGCMARPPFDMDNVCVYLAQDSTWLWSGRSAEAKYGIPFSTQLAILAAVARKTPYTLQSDYSTPQDETYKDKLSHLLKQTFNRQTARELTAARDTDWALFQQQTNPPKFFRDEFQTASYYVAWYLARAAHRLHLPTTNVASLYIAYRVGIEDFHNEAHKTDYQMRNEADHVAYMASIYRSQILKCEADLIRKPSWLPW